ncbi:pyridoxal-phosphate dependent enzyme [Aquipuribacter hungaricus]|uniref:Pyridoxal-phosphate dependent enzyme n=1 Tax=Aquipuribacter hungaricus TaxID=545624 RepID=A0ABV7WHN9_9MICO
MTVTGSAWPSYPLGTWPTPLEPAPRLAGHLGLGTDDLWVKRDDLSGLGGGGNKVRKLQHTLHQALQDGAAAVVTTGAPQSNHARLTAAAAARAGLAAVLVLVGDPPEVPAGNLVLDALLGARVVWAGDVDGAGLAARAEEEADRMRRDGVATAVVPFGGTSVVGARGYVEAAAELLRQAPDLRTVVVAVGSGGTMAGLVHGLGADAVLGVDTGAVTDPVHRVQELVRGLAAEAGGPGGAGGPVPEHVRVRTDQVGDGYGTLTDAVRDAMALVARTEGIVLDPVYSGRAAAGLVAAVADGTVRRGERTVLLHTGGLPGLFGHPATAGAWAG